MKILLLEDEKTEREILVREIRKDLASCQIDECSNVIDALAKIAASPPESPYFAAIIDLNITDDPQVDYRIDGRSDINVAGLRVVEELRKRQPYCDAVIHSNYSDLQPIVARIGKLRAADLDPNQILKKGEREDRQRITSRWSRFDDDLSFLARNRVWFAADAAMQHCLYRALNWLQRALEQPVKDSLPRLMLRGPSGAGKNALVGAMYSILRRRQGLVQDNGPNTVSCQTLHLAGGEQAAITLFGARGFPGVRDSDGAFAAATSYLSSSLVQARDSLGKPVRGDFVAGPHSQVDWARAGMVHLDELVRSGSDLRRYIFQALGNAKVSPAGNKANSPIPVGCFVVASHNLDDSELQRDRSAFEDIHERFKMELTLPSWAERGPRAAIAALKWIVAKKWRTAPEQVVIHAAAEDFIQSVVRAGNCSGHTLDQIANASAAGAEQQGIIDYESVRLVIPQQAGRSGSPVGSQTITPPEPTTERSGQDNPAFRDFKEWSVIGICETLIARWRDAPAGSVDLIALRDHCLTDRRRQAQKVDPKDRSTWEFGLLRALLDYRDATKKSVLSIDKSIDTPKLLWRKLLNVLVNTRPDSEGSGNEKSSYLTNVLGGYPDYAKMDRLYEHLRKDPKDVLGADAVSRGSGKTRSARQNERTACYVRAHLIDWASLGPRTPPFETTDQEYSCDDGFFRCVELAKRLYPELVRHS